MRILFFSHYFPPEVNAPASRTYEHCREWVAAGHEVHVITCVPSHPVGVPFRGYRPGWYQQERHDGIVVHRVWTLLAPNKGVVKRTLNYLSFMPSAVWRSLMLGRFDVLIGTSPQFFCAVATWIAASLGRTPWVFELRDLWPESIHAVGAARAYMPLKMLERLELLMYAQARSVVCVSEAFVRNLVSRGVPTSKISFVPNGVDTAMWTAGVRAKGRAKLDAGESDIIVSYIGTVGMAHDIGTVLDAARLLGRERPRLRFVIIGDGAEREALAARARAEGLDNVTFTGLVPRAEIPDYLAASDVSLVTLKPSDLFKTVLPSKMFESMAAARAIVLAVDGEARQVLERAGAGLAVAPGNAAALADAVRRLAADPELRQTLGAAGSRFVERDFSRRTWAHRYLDVLDRTRLPGYPAAVPQPSPEL
ncbi:MAG: glycosyltransferase WbuB [Acidobacteria bacterium]|nr:MAG: glycosyltransferase WbuB [Acidobacteriota bacterium]